MKNNRILFLTPGLAGGGAERALVNLINSLDVIKYEVHIFTESLASSRCKEIDRAIEYSCHTQFGSLFFGKKTKHLQREFILSFNGTFIATSLALPRHDVLFLFRDSLFLTKLLAAKDEHATSILRIATDYTNNGLAVWKRTINKNYLKMHTDCYCLPRYILAGSKEAAYSFSVATGISKNVTTVKNIFDVDRIRLMAADNIDTRKIRFTIGSVGRPHPDKGFERLLDVCKRLSNEGFNFDLWLVGPDINDETIAAKINEHGLLNVTLFGYQGNPYKFMRHFDLFVNPAFSEGSPNTPVEAVILGIPCVVADHCGEREIFGENNEYGIIVENSEDGLYEGIKQMMADKELYEKYIAAVAERQSFFDPQRTLAEYERLFESDC